MIEPHGTLRGTDHILTLIKQAELALLNASVVVQVASGDTLARQSLGSALTAWLDQCDNNLRLLRQTLAAQTERAA